MPEAMMIKNVGTWDASSESKEEDIGSRVDEPEKEKQ